MLVDDTYNANPTSLKAALNAVPQLLKKSGSIIVGLGEMLELGNETVQAHREAGGSVAKIGATLFLAMGEHAVDMIEGALEAGMAPGSVKEVLTHEDMVECIKEQVKAYDLILLKGSRRMRLDKVVEGLKNAF